MDDLPAWPPSSSTSKSLIAGIRLESTARGSESAGTRVDSFAGDWPMRMSEIPFGTTNWSRIAPTEHPGETGTAFWRTQTFGDIRVRMVEYTPGYLADHWCVKGHILLCLEGELQVELRGGSTHILAPGMSYQVADDAEPHRSRTKTGARLFIVD